MHEYLGYKMGDLVRKLREHLAEDYPLESLRKVLNDGWHVDHTVPLMSFQVIDEATKTIDWDKFRECWDPSNLRAIPAEDNLAKGAKIL